MKGFEVWENRMWNEGVAHLAPALLALHLPLNFHHLREEAKAFEVGARGARVTNKQV